MKISISTLAFMYLLLGACSKAKLDVNETLKLQMTHLQSLQIKGETPSLPDDGEAKKYAEIICYVNNDPCQIGTECSVIGRNCKKYSCKITSAGRIIAPLSNNQIDYFAEKDAQNLLDKGLIDAAEFENFKNFSKKIIANKSAEMASKKY